MLLSLVMPVYNEGETLRTILERVGRADLGVPFELIVVDDGSHDGAVDAIDPAWVPDAERILVCKARRNRGKGSALRKGFELARGNVIGVQDADLEYDPAEIAGLVRPLTIGRADVVFGTRQFGAQQAYTYWYVVGNRLMSTFASAVTNYYVTDSYTCYKFFTRERYEQLQLTADGFEIEAELTGGLLRDGAKFVEVPISYAARSRAEGKKIHASDGLRGVARLVRVKLRGH